MTDLDNHHTDSHTIVLHHPVHTTFHDQDTVTLTIDPEDWKELFPEDSVEVLSAQPQTEKVNSENSVLEYDEVSDEELESVQEVKTEEKKKLQQQKRYNKPAFLQSPPPARLPRPQFQPRRVLLPTPRKSFCLQTTKKDSKVFQK